MKYRKKIGIILLLAFVLFLIGIALDKSHIIGLCDKRALSCRQSLDSIGKPLEVFFFYSIFPFFALLFVKKAVYESWKKFATYFLPIAAVWVLLAPESSGGPFKIPLDSRPQVIFFLSILFLIISLLIIIIKSIKLAGKPEGVEKKK